MGLFQIFLKSHNFKNLYGSSYTLLALVVQMADNATHQMKH